MTTGHETIHLRHEAPTAWITLSCPPLNFEDFVRHLEEVERV
jgi:hypothetical protein